MSDAQQTGPLAAESGALARGVAAMFTAVFLFGAVNALVKWLSATYPIQEILLFRTGFALLPCALLLRGNGAWTSLRTARAGAHVLRGLLGIGALALLFVSFAVMPLADATALYFSAPLFIVVLSWPLLGERVPWDRWLAVGVGFAGVLLVVGPSSRVFGLAAGVPLVASVLLALSLIMSRRLSRTEPSAVIALYFTAISTLAVLPFAPFGWVTPDPLDTLLLCLSGIVGGVGVYLLTYAYQLAPATVVAPLDYLSVLWAAAFGYWLWTDIPGWPLATGAALIAGGGIYIVRRVALDRRAAKAR